MYTIIVQYYPNFLDTTEFLIYICTSNLPYYECDVIHFDMKTGNVHNKMYFSLC